MMNPMMIDTKTSLLVVKNRMYIKELFKIIASHTMILVEW